MDELDEPFFFVFFDCPFNCLCFILLRRLSFLKPLSVVAGLASFGRLAEAGQSILEDSEHVLFANDVGLRLFSGFTPKLKEAVEGSNSILKRLSGQVAALQPLQKQCDSIAVREVKVFKVPSSNQLSSWSCQVGERDDPQ